MYKVETKIVINKGDELETMVQIKQDSPFVLLTSNLKGDLTNKPDEELIEMVKEDFYVTNYFNRAEKEYVKELREQLKNSNQLLEDVQMAMMEVAMTDDEIIKRLTALEYKNKEVLSPEEVTEEVEVVEPTTLPQELHTDEEGEK